MHNVNCMLDGGDVVVILRKDESKGLLQSVIIFKTAESLRKARDS